MVSKDAHTNILHAQLHQLGFSDTDIQLHALISADCSTYGAHATSYSLVGASGYGVSRISHNPALTNIFHRISSSVFLKWGNYNMTYVSDLLSPFA